MDSLLASYASDDEEDNEQEETPQPSVSTSQGPFATQIPRRSFLLGHLPPPKNPTVSTSHQFISSPAPTGRIKNSSVPAFPSNGKPPLPSKVALKSAGTLLGSLPAPQLTRTSDLSSPISSKSHIKTLEKGLEKKTDIQTYTEAADAPNSEISLPSGPSLFASLPPPKVETVTVIDYAKPETSSPVSRPSLFGALPLPKSEPGIDNPKIKKQIVAFRPPVNISLLDSNNEDDEGPMKKKAKAERSTTTENGVGLLSLLPPPKNSLGAGATLGGGSAGGRRTTMETISKVADEEFMLEEKTDVAVGRVSTPAEADVDRQNSATAFGGAKYHDNSMYAVDQSYAESPQVHYSSEQYGWGAAAEAYPPVQYANPPAYQASRHHEENGWQNPGHHGSQSSQASTLAAGSAVSDEQDDPVARVLKAERRRGREDKMPPPTVVEVKQADLTGGRMREDQLRPTGIAFGPSYAVSSLFCFVS